MAFTYWLPDSSGKKVDYTTESNAVIIIGANGAGKSKLGAWIEQQDFAKVHRVAAQRNLNFNENIPLKNYSEASNRLLYGTEKCDDPNQNRKGYKWGWWENAHFTTTLVNDFDDTLAALLALKANEYDRFVNDCRAAETAGKTHPHTPVTVVDKLFAIWKDVLPERELILNDSKFYAVLRSGEQSTSYAANQMSDGERAVLYLSAQVLSVPEDRTIIVDEPEVHLHRSIMNRLWSALEKYRSDCLFIYITHDTQFAALHTHADKIWIKDYNGQNWNFENITGSELPEELLMDILGSRKNVLFVEGEKNSFDTQLYTQIFSTYIVIPCGSCTQVIARTKAFRNNPSLHDCNVYGIIDRDYRSDYEIEKYKADGIYTLGVAEVENLFIVEELVRFMAEHMGKDADKVFSEVSHFVISERFAKQINGQICQAVVSEIKYLLSCADISKKDDAEAQASLTTVLSSIDYSTIRAQKENAFNTILASGNYVDVIKVFNEKGIATKCMGKFFAIDKKAYCSTVVALLKGKYFGEIATALAPYLPKEIPQ